MKIELTAYTPSPLRQMYLAAKRCTTAALDVNGVKRATLAEAKRIIKEFAERKVN